MSCLKVKVGDEGDFLQIIVHSDVLRGEAPPLAVLAVKLIQLVVTRKRMLDRPQLHRPRIFYGHAIEVDRLEQGIFSRGPRLARRNVTGQALI